MATDNFDRADETPIGSGWSKSGATTYGKFNLASNEAKGSGGGSNGGYDGSFANDQYAQCVLKGSSWGYAGPCVRVTPGGSGTDGMYMLLALSPNGLYLFKRVADGYTELTPTLDSSYTPAANDVLKITVSGTTIEGFVNASSKGTRTDPAVTSGQPGLHFNDSTSRVDDFEGGDLGGAPAFTPRLALLGVG